MSKSVLRLVAINAGGVVRSYCGAIEGLRGKEHGKLTILTRITTIIPLAIVKFSVGLAMHNLGGIRNYNLKSQKLAYEPELRRL